MIVGIDIGSRSMEAVVIVDGAIQESRQLPTTFDPMSQCVKLLDGLRPSSLVGTGYGRNLIHRLNMDCEVTSITEIKAHALGAIHFFPEVRTILDIGGQDTKAISVNSGRVMKFEMNDRCAAGTGKFLEYTAGVFQIPIEEFGEYASRGSEPPEISSICTVFAETEATSLMARGEKPESIALGLHKAIIKRTLTMLNRVGLNYPLVFTGGVAHNPCIRQLLVQSLDTAHASDILFPEQPDMTGALGAALSAIQ